MPDLRHNPTELMHLAEFLRETYPVYIYLGQTFTNQRQGVHDAAGVLEVLAREQGYTEAGGA